MITLHLDYDTTHMVSDKATLRVHFLCDGDIVNFPLSSMDGINWCTHIDAVPRDVGDVGRFFFSVVDEDGYPLREEWRRSPHVLPLEALRNRICTVWCRWQDAPEDAFLYSDESVSPADCQQDTATYSTAGQSDEDHCMVMVRAPHLLDDERLYLVGESPALGSWDVQKGIVMQQIGESRWSVALPDDALTWGPTAVKFVARNTEKVRWETGENRQLRIEKDRCVVTELPDVSLDFPHPRHAGTLVPVFSLRSEGSCGVGDFGDLCSMIDWIADTGQKVLQLLPVNDTSATMTWHDSYPYSAVSVFALHPIYIDLRQLPDVNMPAKHRRRWEKERQQLNAQPVVHYEAVMKLKNEYIQLSFAEQWEQVRRNRDFRQWFKEQAEWLVPYAAWCAHRDTYHTPDSDHWRGQERWKEQEREKWTIHTQQKHTKNNSPKHTDTPCHYYTFYQQWVLHRQLTAAHQHAIHKGIKLKGDIGIGVHPHSADVWQKPENFIRSLQAGAPPDFFSQKGQNWGFPLYNWQTMRKEKYTWWKQRLKHMQNYFDIFRLDHIIGFCRIWAIPLGTDDGREGHFVPAHTLQKIPDQLPAELFVPDTHTTNTWHPRIDAQQQQTYNILNKQQQNKFNSIYQDYFYHRQETLWHEEGIGKLSALINATHMIPCAEDLGMVPACMPHIMHNLKILTLQIQLMPKQPEDGQFGNTKNYPYLSVCMTTTHDMQPLRLWWQKDRKRVQQYYNQVMHQSGQAPETLTPQLAAQIINTHLKAPSMMCIIPIQDWLATEQTYTNDTPQNTRINNPAHNKHYWQYRMPCTIEQLQADKKYKNKIKQYITQSQRA